MDNADNNDTMLAEVLFLLRRDHRITYNATHHRLRCQGHIINLIIQAFLFSLKKDKKLINLYNKEDKEQDKEEEEEKEEVI